MGIDETISMYEKLLNQLQEHIDKKYLEKAKIYYPCAAYYTTLVSFYNLQNGYTDYNVLNDIVEEYINELREVQEPYIRMIAYLNNFKQHKIIIEVENSEKI